MLKIFYVPYILIRYISPTFSTYLFSNKIKQDIIVDLSRVFIGIKMEMGNMKMGMK